MKSNARRPIPWGTSHHSSSWCLPCAQLSPASDCSGMHSQMHTLPFSLTSLLLWPWGTQWHPEQPHVLARCTPPLCSPCKCSSSVCGYITKKCTSLVWSLIWLTEQCVVPLAMQDAPRCGLTVIFIRRLRGSTLSTRIQYNSAWHAYLSTLELLEAILTW